VQHPAIRWALGLGVCLVLLVAAERGRAQVNPYRVQQRYNEAAKGKNIGDWVHRLREGDAEKRLEAVKSLGDSGNPEAVQYLIEAMGDPEDSVKIKAIDYLGKIRATAATTVMVQKLFMRGVEPRVKQRILVALGRMGDVKAVRPITEFLGQDTDPTTCATAVFALGEIGDHSAVERLEEIRGTTDDPNLARLAGEAIAKIDRRLSPATVAVTVPALEEDEPPKSPLSE
jgi:HEAT repeat protein